MSTTQNKSLLDSLFDVTPQDTEPVEKIAEDQFLRTLTGEGSIESTVPYSDMPLADLIALASDLEGAEKTASAEAEEAPAEYEEMVDKTAALKLRGQLMAHAATHELELIKEAMTKGLCKVCKEAPRDPKGGSSMCAACARSVTG